MNTVKEASNERVLRAASGLTSQILTCTELKGHCLF